MVVQRQAGSVTVNSPAYSGHLQQPTADTPGVSMLTADAWPDFVRALHDLLAAGASDDLHPAGYLVTGVAWSGQEPEQLTRELR